MDIIKEIKKNPDRNFFISASAGTGKTYTLTKYYISILEKNVGNPDITDSILAVTFTNKAAGEMRERIMAAVEEKIMSGSDNSYWEEIKINLSRAWIKTIDSFCSKIIRENNILVGVDPNFSIISELKKEREIDRTVKTALALVFSAYDDKSNREIIENYSNIRKQNILKHLDIFEKDKERFRKAIKEFLREKRVEEIENMLSGSVKNQRIEMQKSLLLEDFELSDTEKSKIYTDILWIYRNTVNIATEIYYYNTLDQFQFDHKAVLEKTLEVFENEIILEKYRNKFKYIIVDEYQDTNYLQKELFDRIYTGNNFLFYVGDRKQSIYRFRGADVSVFSKTYQEFRNRNDITEELITNRRSDSQIIDFVNEMVSGVLFDKNQIYVDGVDQILLDDIAFKKSDMSISESENNNTVNPKIGKNDCSRVKKVYAEYEEKINADERKETEINAFVKIIKKLYGQELYFRKRKENGEIFYEKRKIKYSDFAVLLRQISGYEERLKEKFRKEKIPFYIYGSKTFYNRPEIQAIFSALGAIQNPQNNFEMTKYMFSLMGGITFEEYDKFLQMRNETETLYEVMDKNFESMREQLKKSFSVIKKYKELKYFLNPSVILKNIIEESDYIINLSAFDDFETSVSNVKKILIEAEEFSSITSSFSELVRILKNISSVSEEEAVIEDEKSDSVKIMTIHKSKGLEFPIVIIGGISGKEKNIKEDVEFSMPDSYENRFFILNNIFKEELEQSDNYAIKWMKNNLFLDSTESNRLMYVALTRAKEMLIPVIIKNKNETGKTVSRFFEYESSVADEINYYEIEDVKTEETENTQETPKVFNQENLNDLRKKAYRKYIAPTFLIEETGEIKNYEEDGLMKSSEIEYYKEISDNNYYNSDYEFFSDNEILYRGSYLHDVLRSAYDLKDIIYIENNLKNHEIKLPENFSEDENIKFIFGPGSRIIKNEWRLVKNIEICKREYMLFGIPDKVIIENGKIYLVDYKYSDLKNKDKIKNYIFQMNFYMYLLKDFGIPEKCYIISLKRKMKPIIFNYDEKFEEKLINIIKSTDKNI